MTTTENLRIIAYIGARLISKESTTTLYDHQSKTFHRYSGEFSGEAIKVFDHNEDAWVQGSVSKKNGLIFYRHKDESYFNIHLNKNEFLGFDKRNETYFAATLRKTTVSIYDKNSHNYFNYSYYKQ